MTERQGGEVAAEADGSLRVLMIGPVPRIYGGISAVTGMLLDSALPGHVHLTYLAEGTRRGLLHKLWRFGVTLARTARSVLTRRVDLLHLHVGDGSSLYRHALYTALGRLAGCPVIFHWHLNAGVLISRQAGRWRSRSWLWALAHADRVVVLSPRWRPDILAVAPRARVAVLPNPVDCTAVGPAAESAAPSGAPGPVLYLGDFSPGKGVQDLLTAAPAVLEQHPGARFVICGDRPPASLRSLAGPLGGAVAFPGYVRGAAKLALLQEAALLVLPSYDEGLPVALLEAMAAGLPVVATPVGAVADVVEEGRNGLLVPPGDPAALAAAIDQLLADDDLRHRMGRQNRSQALAEFDLPVYVHRLLNLYREVMRDAQGAFEIS